MLYTAGVMHLQKKVMFFNGKNLAFRSSKVGSALANYQLYLTTTLVVKKKKKKTSISSCIIRDANNGAIHFSGLCETNEHLYDSF